MKTGAGCLVIGPKSSNCQTRPGRDVIYITGLRLTVLSVQGSPCAHVSLSVCAYSLIFHHFRLCKFITFCITPEIGCSSYFGVVGKSLSSSLYLSELFSPFFSILTARILYTCPHFYFPCVWSIYHNP